MASWEKETNVTSKDRKASLYPRGVVGNTHGKYVVPKQTASITGERAFSREVHRTDAAAFVLATGSGYPQLPVPGSSSSIENFHAPIPYYGAARG
ncbi:hypothetical protein ZHAS_00020480 [Anopheles sinensis]|uniref:Uncharacterized protein n=1 Tax=Anopheles sinensis TaxID=74873 RepID=A0A084WPE4_ANOSI|nr:hypothetical protein ZHAS_00020480 [Anopheles sinensis]